VKIAALILCLLLAHPAAAEELERTEDPAWFVPILSAQICDAQADQKAAKEAIANHKGIARRSGGGVVDLRLIARLQKAFRKGEEQVVETRRALKVRRKAPLACTMASVRPLLGCTDLILVRDGGDAYDRCREPNVRPYLDVLEELTVDPYSEEE
jgi:hypothetical protein